MTISEAIKVLQKIKKRHGDLTLVRESWDGESIMSVYDDAITERDFKICVDNWEEARRIQNEYGDSVEMEYKTGHKKCLLY